ncbi:hypothetical protein [Liquorilactobacillus nagelii]|uniref:hypothetical protein n=1 Tax=Liquorilactobacillus nagelii TaxID=82688 RepID=UPI0039E9F66D
MTRKNFLEMFLTILMIFTGFFGVGLSLKSQGTGAFLMYTIDSNLLNLIVNLLVLCSWIANVNIKKFLEHNILLTLRYTAACCLGLTFLIVILVLGPMMGYRQLLFTGPMIFNHLLNPLLAVGSYLLLNDQTKLNFRNNLLALIPTILYGIIIIVLNILKIIKGPYPFLMVRYQSLTTTILWILIILLINFIVAKLLQWATQSIQ